jgi:hypothetical protein
MYAAGLQDYNEEVPQQFIKQMAQEEPKFKKSKLFNFLDGVSSGAIKEPKKKKKVTTKKKKTVAEPVKNLFDNIYNETGEVNENTTTRIEEVTEDVAIVKSVPDNKTSVTSEKLSVVDVSPIEQILPLTPAVPTAAPIVSEPVTTEHSFATYNFEADDQYNKKLQHLKKQGVFDTLSAIKRDAMVLKLKAKHYKTIDPSFDIDQFNKDHVTATDIQDQTTEHVEIPIPTNAEVLAHEASNSNQEEKSKEYLTTTPTKPTNVEESLSPTAQEDIPPYPASYSQVILNLHNGINPPNIKEIDDKPKNPNQKPTPSTKPKREKPWLKKKNQKDSQIVINSTAPEKVAREEASASDEVPN